jgi:predicted metal-binding membrane protein
VSAHEHESAIGALPATSLPRGEFLARGAATAIFLVAAAYTFYAAGTMSGGMPMPGGWTMPMMWMVMPGQSAFAAAAMFLLMWQAMMIAMMLPSSWPMLSLYRRVAEYHQLSRAWRNTVLVAAGYFAVWLAFGVAAFILGFTVSAGAMRSDAVSKFVPLSAGAALILAGLYQLSPLKQTCLKHCREPVLFLGHIWKPGAVGALRIGIAHGAFCAACCWALMLMQMVLGVMNLAVMIVVAAIIGTEKLWKRGPALSRAVGVVSIAAGIAVIALWLKRIAG